MQRGHLRQGEKGSEAVKGREEARSARRLPSSPVERKDGKGGSRRTLEGRALDFVALQLNDSIRSNVFPHPCTTKGGFGRHPHVEGSGVQRKLTDLEMWNRKRGARSVVRTHFKVSKDTQTRLFLRSNRYLPAWIGRSAPKPSGSAQWIPPKNQSCLRLSCVHCHSLSYNSFQVRN